MKTIDEFNCKTEKEYLDWVRIKTLTKSVKNGIELYKQYRYDDDILFKRVKIASAKLVLDTLIDIHELDFKIYKVIWILNEDILKDMHSFMFENDIHYQD